MSSTPSRRHPTKLLFFPLLLRASISSPAPFLTDSILTPSLYSLIKTLVTRSQLDYSRLIKTTLLAGANPTRTLARAEANIRFRSFARDLYLATSFKAPIVPFTPTAIPASTLFRHFPELPTWDRSASHSDEDAHKNRLLAQASIASPGKLVDSWTLEDALEAIGCCVAGTSSFNLWCEQTRRYDVWTAEYVSLLAQRVAHHSTILEVGAGDGSLSHYLSLALAALNSKARVVATDSGAWRIPSSSRVLKMDCQRAVNVLRPDCVICAWMPMGMDLTQAMRAAPSVREYILIGEADEFGCCGHAWLTWGRPELHSQQQAPLDVFDWLSRSSAAPPPGPIVLPRTTTPPYLNDGFVRHDLPELARWQFSRYDRRLRAGNSTTVAFARA